MLCLENGVLRRIQRDEGFFLERKNRPTDNRPDALE
jgi:hypothetical protein